MKTEIKSKEHVSLGKYYICQFIKFIRSRLLRKPTDNIIIEGLRLQDEKILNYLYDDYYQSVKNHVLKNSGSLDDASDVLQESVITLYKQVSCPDFKLTTDLKGYFFGIVKNTWNSQLRLKKRTTELDMDMINDPDNEDIADPILEKVVTKAFARLKPDCQTILKLFSEGFSYEEIAIRMNLKNETYARRKKYLCKEALIEIIKEYPEFKDIQRFLK
jgi:RNA polymerase sigma factor (sigma-70 family)